MRRVFKEDIYILGLLNIYTANNKSLATVSLFRTCYFFRRNELLYYFTWI